MAVVVKEILHQSEQTQLDWQKKGQRIRTFIAATQDPDQAKVALANDFDPPVQVNQPHNRDASMICDDIQTAPTGNGHTEIVAYYSNDRRFGSPRVRNREEPASDIDFIWTQRDVEIELPLQRLAYKTIGEGDTEQTVGVWTLTQPIKRRERRTGRSLKTRVSVARLADLDEIALQAMTLHNIANTVYLFTGGTSVLLDGQTYEITYNWEYDRGTPNPTILGGAGDSTPLNIQFINPNEAVPELPIRNPYTKIEPVPPQDPREDAPDGGLWRGRFIYPYGRPENATDGWRRLPGVPNLG